MSELNITNLFQYFESNGFKIKKTFSCDNVYVLLNVQPVDMSMQSFYINLSDTKYDIKVSQKSPVSDVKMYKVSNFEKESVLSNVDSKYKNIYTKLVDKTNSFSKIDLDKNRRQNISSMNSQLTRLLNAVFNIDIKIGLIKNKKYICYVNSDNQIESYEVLNAPIYLENSILDVHHSYFVSIVPAFGNIHTLMNNVKIVDQQISVNFMNEIKNFDIAYTNIEKFESSIDYVESIHKNIESFKKKMVNENDQNKKNAICNKIRKLRKRFSELILSIDRINIETELANITIDKNEEHIQMLCDHIQTLNKGDSN